MSCEEWREDVSAWVDGELSSRRWAEVDAHIKACRDCRRLARGFNELTAMARRAPVPRASSRATAAALALVRERGWRQHKSWWSIPRVFLPQLSLGAAGLAIAGFLGLMVIHSGLSPFSSGSDQSTPRLASAAPAVAPQVAGAQAPPIIGRLTVADSAAGADRLATLARSLGGQVSDAAPSAPSTVYVTIPASAREAFQTHLGEIGKWENASTSSSAPGSVVGIQVIQRR